MLASALVRPLAVQVALTGFFAATLGAAPEHDALAQAAKLRTSLVRVSRVDARRPYDSYERVGVAVREDGLVLVAGPVVLGNATYTARLPGGDVAAAQFLAADEETALTLLRVRGQKLIPLPGLAARAPEPSAGASFVMVTADGAVSRGALRAGDRFDRIRQGTRSVRTTALLESALSSLAQDRGAPWVTADGTILGLHYGRTLGTDPRAELRARALGLRLRREVVASYAVPAGAARIVWPLLAEHGRVPRGALDVRTVAMDEAMRAQLCPDCGGHVVVHLQPDGAGAKAGLRRHDVILGIGGVPLPRNGTLQDALLPHRPGARVSLEVLRAGQRQSLQVRLGQRSR